MQNTAASEPSGENLLHSFDLNESGIWTAQYSTYSPGGYGDVLDSAHGTYTVTLNDLKKVLKDKHSAGRRLQGSSQPEKAPQRRGSPNYEESGPNCINCEGWRWQQRTFSPPSGQRTWTLMPLAQSPPQQRKQFQENRAALPPSTKQCRHLQLTCNRPWRPIGLWDVKDPTLSRLSAHS
jgi:hypothetical protein